MLGIGGGGIISPLLLMMGFNPKKITTITALLFLFLHYPDFLPTGQLAQLIGDY